MAKQLNNSLNNNKYHTFEGTMIDYRLIEAVKNNNYTEAKKCINTNVEIERTDKNDRTALIWAAKQNNFDLVDLLLCNHANVHATDKHGHTALTIAAANGNTNMVERLLNAGAQVDHFNKSQKTALTLAAEHGHVDVIQQLLRAKADINQVNVCGETTLLSVIKQGKLDMVQWLLRHGANINQADQSGKTALTWAVDTLDATMVNVLLVNNAEVNVSDETGKTPLIYAIEKENVAMVELLIKAKATINEAVLKENQILRWAHEHQHTAIIAALLGSSLVNLESSQAEFDAALQRINTITENIQGAEYKLDRKLLRYHLSNHLKNKVGTLTKENSLIKLEPALLRLIDIKDKLAIIQPNEAERKSGKDKSAMKRVKAHIALVQSAVEKLKLPAENTISHKILQLFKVTEDGQPIQPSDAMMRNTLTALMPSLVTPSEGEIEQVRRTVVRLSVEQRKQLRETLKCILDNTAIKNKDDLANEDKWIQQLHRHYKTSERYIPFVAILRVSGSGEKENYKTNTYDHFIQVMQKGAFRHKSGNTPVSNIGFFANNEEDATGQKDVRRLNRFKPGDDVL